MAMTQEDLQALARALAARAGVLRGEVNGKLEQAAADSVGGRGGTDSGEQSFAASESGIDLAEADRDLKELAAINATLTAIDAGTYGTGKEGGLVQERCGPAHRGEGRRPAAGPALHRMPIARRTAARRAPRAPLKADVSWRCRSRGAIDLALPGAARARLNPFFKFRRPVAAHQYGVFACPTFIQ